MYHKCTSSNLNTINQKLFCNQVGIYRFEKKFQKYSREINPNFYWRLKKVSCKACLLFYCFFGDKKQFGKVFLIYTFIPFLLNSFALLQCRIEEMIQAKAIANVSRAAGGRLFLFSWERLEGGQQETIVSSKVVPVDLNMKFISKFNDIFSNRGCLHCGVLKLYTILREKESTRQQICIFFRQNFQKEIFKILKTFENNMKLTRETTSFKNE